MNEGPAGSENRGRTASITALSCLTLVFFAPLLAGRTFSMVGPHMHAQYPWTAIVAHDDRVRGIGYPQTDHAETMYPLSVFATSALRAGEFPIWLPFSFGGLPFVELGTSALLYPIRLLAMLALEPIRQHDLLLFTHLLAAGIGMSRLLREWGADEFGATLGGLTWELNGHNTFWLTLEHIAIAAAWLPLALLAGTHALRRRSFAWSVAAGTGIGMSLLGGNLHYVVLNVLIITGWCAFLVARFLLPSPSWGALARYLELAAGALLVGAALSAAGWLPLLSSLGDVHRQPSSVEGQIADAVPWRSVARRASMLGTDPQPAGKPPDFGYLAYGGLSALALAAASTLSRKDSRVHVALLTCLAGLAIALGWRPIFVLLRATVPFFGTFHPHEGLYVYLFGMASLAGFGLSSGRRWLLAKGIGTSWAAAAACILVVGQAAQLTLFGWNINPQHPADPAWLMPSTPLIEALQASIGDGRMLPVRRHLPGVWTPPVLNGKAPAAFGLRSGSGYESVIPRRTATLWATIEQGEVPRRLPTAAYRTDFLHDRLPFALLEKTSVRLLATPPGVRPVDVSGRDPILEGRLRPVYQGGDGWIYEDVRALPRAFVVSGVRWMTDDAAVLRAMLSPDHDARAEALLVGPRSTEAEPAHTTAAAHADADAAITFDGVNEVAIRTTGSRPGILVLNDSWAPGWKVFVDGSEASVLRVNYAFRGVRLHGGAHDVRFVYRPFSLILGLAISGAAAIVLSVGVVLARWCLSPNLGSDRVNQAGGCR